MTLVDEFCDFHHAYHEISADRRVLQRRVLATLLEGGDLTAKSLRAYLTTRAEAGAKPTTIRKELSAIRPFVAWLWANRIISAEDKMTLDEVPPPRGASGDGTPRPYAGKEIRQFWVDLEYAYPWSRATHRGASSPRESADFYVERWQRGASGWGRVQPYAKRLQIEAVVALALYGGIRREELYRLEIEDMHPDNEYVVVRSARKNKRGEQVVRAVPFVEPMRDRVRAWLEFRELVLREQGATHERPWLSLHQHHRAKPMRFSQFAMLLCRIGRGWEYHRMRHTFATERLRRGLALEKLQIIMGHSKIAQTLVYAKLLTGDIVEASQRSEARFVQAMESYREAA